MSKFAAGVIPSDYSAGWVVSCLSDGSAASKKTVLTEVPAGEAMQSDPRVVPVTDSATLVDNYQYGSEGIGTGMYGIFDPAGIFPEPSAPPLWEVLQTAKTADAPTTVTAKQIWTAANPYGALQKDTKMYLSDYDNGKIFRYTTASNAYSEDKFGANAYYFAPTLPSGATRAGAMGMDAQANGMVVAFTFYSTDESGNYTYQPSGLYLLPVDNAATASVTPLASTTCTENVNGTTVNGDFVYTTSFGGMQQAGGNKTSALEVFQITGSGSNYSFNSIKKIVATDINGISTGDFLGVEVVGDDAFILMANYDESYETYTYQILKVAVSALNADTGVPAVEKRVDGTVSPAGATWGLLKDDNNDLYLVDGVNIKKINPADLSLTTICSASDFTFNSTKGDVLNTAGIVIHASAGMLRGAPGAHVSVAKMARHLAAPKELKKRQKR